MNNLICKGRIWRFGDQVDTDALAPGRHLKLPMNELARHCLATQRAEFPLEARPGDIVVAGVGFGIGSSREQAAGVLRELGIGAVIATGAARIFYRNAINFGLPVLICADTSQLIDGRMVQVDIDAGVVTDSGDQVIARCQPMPDFLLTIIHDGGLVANLRKRLAQGDIPLGAAPR